MRWQEQGGELLSVLVKEASYIWESIWYALQGLSSLAAQRLEVPAAPYEEKAHHLLPF